MAQTSGFDPTTQVKTCFDCKMFDVANWVACLNGENGHGGTPSHEALSVSPQGALEISSVTGQPPSLDRSHFSTPRLVIKFLKCDERCRPSSQDYSPDSIPTSGQLRHIRRPDVGCRRWPNGFLTGGPTLAQRRQTTEKKLLNV